MIKTKSRPRLRFEIPRRSHCRPICEMLEDRTLLSVFVPNSITPGAPGIIQNLFAPDTTQQTIANDVTQKLFQFALDTQAPQGSASFTLTPLAGSSQDAALGLYDASGNLVVQADQDADPAHPGAETLINNVATQQAYYIGVFFNSTSPDQFQLTVTPSPQVKNTTIRIDPGTGAASFQANSGEDTFNSSTDVDYYPLDLTNGGAVGQVTVTPTGLGVETVATLFRGDSAAGPWMPIATGVQIDFNLPVILPFSAPADENLTDGHYLLAVAPEGFNTAARSYQIDVNVDATLSPATISGAGATTLLPAPAGPGIA